MGLFLTRNNRAMEKKTYKPKNPATTVRLPADLHSEIKESAAKEDRSMNDEIILRLRLYPIAAQLDEIEQQNAELKRMVQQLINRQS
jgi:HAMP domain-containing protein